MEKKYFISVYSDGIKKEDYFDTLQHAVRTYSRDIIGHTLVYISDKDYNIVWSADDGYYPGRQISIRAIDEVNKKNLMEAIAGLVPDLLMATAIDPKSQRQGRYASIKYSFDDGVLVLKDAADQNRKIVKITIDVVQHIRHKFRADLFCETCGKNMATIEDPTGLCDLD